jgi:mono/diheme cytochrome c family protein
MNFSHRLLIGFLLVASFAAPVFAQAPTGSLTSDPVYDKSCAKCHGKAAEGRHFGGPSLATSKMSADELKAIITTGKGRMPKFADKLTADEIATLAAEIKAFSGGPSPK